MLEHFVEEEIGRGAKASRVEPDGWDTPPFQDEALKGWAMEANVVT
jgi:hypothetical protein